MSTIIDYQDRTTCVLFGDGAGAVLLEPSTDDTGIMDFYNDPAVARASWPATSAWPGAGWKSTRTILAPAITPCATT